MEMVENRCSGKLAKMPEMREQRISALEGLTVEENICFGMKVVTLRY